MRKNVFTFEGKEYDILANAVLFKDDLTKEILSRRSSAVASVREQMSGLPEDVQRIMISEAIRSDINREVTMAELDRFIHTLEGVAFLAYSVVRRSVPDVTIERITMAINEQMVQQGTDASSANEKTPSESSPPTKAEPPPVSPNVPLAALPSA